jgi:16S rRNA G1207 methylase RsmC
MALRSPAAEVWAVDINVRARELTTFNAQRSGASNVIVAAPTDVPADASFDVIWSNPPIRIGKPALHTLLDTWLSRLAADGVAVLVVQKHLGADSLATWLESRGYRVERLRSRAGFRLLEVRAAR